MTPPTVIEEADGLIVVRKRAGKTRGPARDQDRRGALATSTHEMDEVAGLEKDGVEKHLQEALAGGPTWLEAELRLDRREWMTEIGPVDLMCRDCDDGWVAVEIKRVGTIEAVEQLTRYLGFIRADPAKAGCRGILAAQSFKPQAVTLAESRGIALRRGRPRGAARRARARADPLRLVRPVVLGLAVVVLEHLDPPDHAEPAPGDLVRARVPAHVVRLPRAVDQHRQPVRAGPEPVADPRRRRPRDHVPGPDRDRLLLGARPEANDGDGQRWSVPSPSRMTKISSSSEWQCGTEPRAPGSSRSQWKPAWSERSLVASGAVVERPQCSSSTSSMLRMFGGRSAGSPYASGGASASRSHGSSVRPSTHGQPKRTAPERGSQPKSVGCRVPKTR